MSQDQTWITDITNEIGLDSAFGSRIWLGDFNNDNFTDLLWGTPKATHNNFNLMINNHSNDIFSRKLENLSDKTGTNYNRRRDNKTGVRTTDIASMADFDNNGTLDIISSIYYHRFTGYKDANDPGDRTEILLNDGNLNFSLAESGLNQMQLDAILPQGLINSTGIAFVDYNLDGLTDAYISTWFTDYYATNADVKQKDILVKNVTVGNDVKFERVYIPAIEAVVEPMYGVNATDWNNDGYQDIVTSPYCRTGGSLFAGGPNGTFRDATAEANYSAQHAKRDGPGLLCQWEANPADFDNDGDMDLLQVIVHGGYYEGMGRTVIAVNQGKDKGYKYEWNLDRIRRDAPLTSHLGDMGACWWDIDNDGKLDMAIGQMSYPTANLQGQERLYILRQNDSGYFDDISKKLGIFYTMKEAHSMEPFDYDLDGDHDLIFSRQVRDTIEVDTVINGQQQKVKVEKVYMKIHLLRNNIDRKSVV